LLHFPLNAPHGPVAPSEEWQGKSGINDYADFVMQVDNTVGRVLAALEADGIAESTLHVVIALPTETRSALRVSCLPALYSLFHAVCQARTPSGSLGSQASNCSNTRRASFILPSSCRHQASPFAASKNG
jgi:hypothetical protein